MNGMLSNATSSTMRTSHNLNDDKVPQPMEFQELRHAKGADRSRAGEHAAGQELAQVHAVSEVANAEHTHRVGTQEGLHARTEHKLEAIQNW